MEVRAKDVEPKHLGAKKCRTAAKAWELRSEWNVERSEDSQEDFSLAVLRTLTATKTWIISSNDLTLLRQ